MKPKISIIIVHYQVKRELCACLQSIEVSKPNVTYEIIVVDNDEKEKIKKDLIVKHPHVRYFKTAENIGFGAACNFGAEKSLGTYLFFLNPDSKIIGNCLDLAFNKIKQSKAWIVAPQSLDENNKFHLHQCTGKLSPLTAIVAFSLINKIFPSNRLSKDYWLQDWDRMKEREVEFVEGSAMLISKKNFNKLTGFDEKFFLFFEDTDLCQRIRDRGKKIIYYPKAKVIHLRKKSTKDKKKALKIFQKSRDYFLTKHFGSLRGKLAQNLLLMMEKISNK